MISITDKELEIKGDTGLDISEYKNLSYILESKIGDILTYYKLADEIESEKLGNLYNINSVRSNIYNNIIHGIDYYKTMNSFRIIADVNSQLRDIENILKYGGSTRNKIIALKGDKDHSIKNFGIRKKSKKSKRSKKSKKSKKIRKTRRTTSSVKNSSK